MSSNQTKKREALRSELENRKPFSYDPEHDTLYQQYREQYETLGRQAMEDTVGQASALTGGYGSTYAASAGAEAYNDYLGKLSALVPELYDRSAEAYNQETENLFDTYEAASEEENDAFNHCMELLENGIRPSEEQLSAAGLSASQAATALAIYQYNTGYNPGGTGNNAQSGNGQASSGGNSGNGTVYTGYDNGNLSANQVKTLQAWLGVSADGQYGAKTRAAAEARFGVEGISATQAWIAYQKAVGAHSGGTGGGGGNRDMEY